MPKLKQQRLVTIRVKDSGALEIVTPTEEKWKSIDDASAAGWRIQQMTSTADATILLLEWNDPSFIASMAH